MKYLLDTSACIAVLRHVEPAARRLKQETPDDCAVSTVTTYELMTGARKYRRPDREGSKVETFLAPLHEIVLTREDAFYAAKIRGNLERKGLIIGPYDLLLAGQAMARGVTLVTFNTEEFERVDRLNVTDWR